MVPSISSLPRAARRRLMRVVHKIRDKDHGRRAPCILQLAEGLRCVKWPVGFTPRPPPSTAGGTRPVRRRARAAASRAGVRAREGGPQSTFPPAAAGVAVRGGT